MEKGKQNPRTLSLTHPPPTRGFKRRLACSNSMLRSPICSVLGHVDHGKSSLLDTIRGTTIVTAEPGAITQAIGASIVPRNVITKLAGDLLKRFSFQLSIPGLLFIDTPGHAAFTSMRKRGGSLADIALLVVDVNEGFMPQTLESIEILKQYKTPFILAANKVDLIPGWKPSGEQSILKALEKQAESVRQNVDVRVYELVGKLQELGFDAERFDRVSDYTRQVAIIPVSAKTGEGIAEVLMLIAALSQRYLADRLEITPDAPGRGVILEVKEEKGLGVTIDVILHDGMIKPGDVLLTPSLTGIIKTRVRGILMPQPLQEMRDRKASFKPVREAVAAAGVKILAPGIAEAVAGMPVRFLRDEREAEHMSRELQAEVDEVLLEEGKEGILVKADTLGSLEAVLSLLREHDIPVRKARLGPVSRRDVIDAAASQRDEEKIILAFNTSIHADAEDLLAKERVIVIRNDIIYKLIDEYHVAVERIRREKQREALKRLTRPARIGLLPGYVFRQSNPAIVGVLVEKGVLTPGVELMREDGKKIGRVKSIQLEGESVSEAEEGKRVAVSIEGAIVGRQIEEGMTLYTFIPEHEFKEYKTYRDVLTPSEKEVLNQIATIRRKENPVWGV